MTTEAKCRELAAYISEINSPFDTQMIVPTLLSAADEIKRLREVMDKAMRETGSDPDNRWCRNATAILTAALKED